MSRQLPLAVELPPRTTLGDFVTGDNGQPLAAVRRLAEGVDPGPLFLSGPAGCGKSHLLTAAVALAQKNGGQAFYLPLAEVLSLSPDLLDGLADCSLLAIDDLHCLAGHREWEQALFHLYNQSRAAGTALLFAARKGPARLELTLPDLQSRLSWGTSYALRPLDDRGREALLLRQASQRGLRMSADAARWMVRHCSRDPRRLLALLEGLDRASLASHRRLTLPFVRSQLSECRE